MKNVIFETDEMLLIKKKYAKEFLEECFNNIAKSGDYEEDLEYFKEENERLLEEIKDLDNEEIVCFRDCAMSGYLIVVDKESTKEYIETYIVNEDNIKELEEELKVHNFHSCVEYEVLQMIRLKFENLLKSNVVTMDKIKDIASNVLDTEEFNMLLDNLIIEELEKIKE